MQVRPHLNQNKVIFGGRNNSIIRVEFADLTPVIEIPTGVFAAIFFGRSLQHLAAVKVCPASLDTSTCHFFTFSSATVEHVEENKCCYCCHARQRKSGGKIINFLAWDGSFCPKTPK